MNKIYLGILMVFLTSSVLLAEDHEGRFIQAVELYKKEKFDEAISIYQEIIEAGLESSSLYLSLGNAYFKKGDMAYAMLYYEKGKKLNSDIDGFNINIGITQQEIDSDVSQISDFFLLTWWVKWRDFMNSSAWAISSLFLFAGFIIIVYDRLFQKWSLRPGIALYGMIVSIFFSILTLYTSIQKYKSENSHEHAIVMQAVILKSGPDERSDDLRQLKAGEKVQMIDQIGEWNKVVLRNKSMGWIAQSKLGLI